MDVPLAFQALAQRIARLVPCDRVGLALLSEDGQEFQTYTARVHRGRAPRAAAARDRLQDRADRARLRRPLARAAVIPDIEDAAPDFLDINVLHTSGFKSALMLPLVSQGRAVGTLNVVSRKHDAFKQSHVDMLQPIAEIFAVAYVAQQLHMAVGKHRTMEAMSELTLSMAAEINSALQTIIGHCDLLERGYPDPSLQPRPCRSSWGKPTHRRLARQDAQRRATSALGKMAQTIDSEGVARSRAPRERRKIPEP